jgi:ABC-type multidrug transport system ATPase subunit
VSVELLVAEEPRLSEGGLELGRCAVSGPHVVLVGAWSPLFELFAGRRRLEGGALRVAGTPAEAAAARGVLGLMLRDAPLPPTWSLRQVVVSSALLAGVTGRQAVARAQQVLSQLELVPLAGTPLVRLRPGERRAAGVAAALVADAAVLALEEPFFELEPSDQEWLARVIERAIAGRAALISLPALPGSPSEGALAARGSELLFLSGRRLAARGTYRELSQGARSYRVIVQRSVDALLSRLGEAGYEVRRMLAADVTTLLVTDTHGAGTVPLFEAALAADAPIIELAALELGALPRAALPGAVGPGENPAPTAGDGPRPVTAGA